MARAGIVTGPVKGEVKSYSRPGDWAGSFADGTVVGRTVIESPERPRPGMTVQAALLAVGERGGSSASNVMESTAGGCAGAGRDVAFWKTGRLRGLADMMLRHLPSANVL